MSESSAGQSHLSENAAASILESIADGFYALDRDWRFTLFNDQCERYFGLRRSNVLHRSYRDVFPLARGTVFERALQTAFATGKPQTAEGHSPVTGVPILLRAFPSEAGLTVVFTDVTERTITDQALRRSEERYRSLFGSIDEGFCLVEVLFEGERATDYRFLEVNPAFEQHTGLRDVVGKTMRNLVPGHEEHWFSIYGEVAQTGKAVRFESEAKAIGGRWFDVSAFRIGEPEERTVGILFADVTERRRAEQALTALERQKSFLLELGDQLRPLTDPLEVTTTASQALGRHLGVSRVGYGEIDPNQQIVSVERDWTDGSVESLAGESRPLDVFGPAIVAVLRRGETLRLDDIASDPVAAPYAEGYASIGTRSLLIVPLVKKGVFKAILYLHEPEPRHWTDTEAELAREVAERTWAALESTLARSELRKSEQRFEAIANSIDQMIWSTLPDGYHDYYNRRWYEYTGMPVGSTDGQGWKDLFHPDDQERASQLWHHCLETGEPYHIEYRLRHHTGQYRWVIGRALPVRDAQGEIERWYGTCTDVHDLKVAEAALRDANETLEWRVAERTRELQEAVAESEGFNYSISHDLRAPLRAIVATASILLEEVGPELESEHREMLQRQALNAKRLGTLIDELLRLSRLARAEVRCLPLDMTTKAHEVAAMELADRESNAVVEIQDGMTTEGDPNLVRTLLHNLIGNAIKFSPDGGTVRVWQEGNVFHISDEGVGFDMKYVQKIFRPFERLVLESEFPGTGIGLANVERIVRRHGGRVWATSEPGKGSTFSFTLGSGEG